MLDKEQEELLSNVDLDTIKDNLETGVILAIKEHSDILDTQLKDLSKKELVRLAKSAASFPEPYLPKGASNPEIKAVQTLYAIKDLQVELAICTIGRQQEELIKAENGEPKENENED